MGNIDFATWAIPTPAATFGPEDFKRALSKYATGVTVVTAVDDSERPYGLAVNSFVSGSMEPPLVLWCLRRASSLFDKFTSASKFGVNILAAHQLELARKFSAKVDDRFAGVPYEFGAHGCPILPGVAATLECDTFAQYIAGDHLIFIGEVRTCSDTGATPLIFHSKGYWTAKDAMACGSALPADVVRASSLDG